MAEAFTRMYASGQVEAYSAGSRPSGKVNPRAIEFMGELSYDLTTHQSKGLDALPPGPFAAAITMGCGDACPNVPAAIHEDWGIPDPKELPADDFRRIRDQIGAKVRELLGRIAQPIT
jgi:arsenate reductase